MTKTNLGEHLHWLIRSSTTIPLQSESHRNLTKPAEPTENISAAESATVRPSQRISRSEVGRENAPEVETISEAIYPQLPASALNTQARNDMARLQTSPAVSSIPQVSSRRTPRPLHTSDQSISRLPGTSLSERYTGQFDRKREGKTQCFFFQKWCS